MSMIINFKNTLDELLKEQKKLEQNKEDSKIVDSKRDVLVQSFFEHFYDNALFAIYTIDDYFFIMN